MIYFLKKEKYFLDRRDVQLEYVKKLNTREYKLFTLIAKNYSSNSNGYVSIPFDKILKDFKISKEKLKGISERLLEKKIYYKVNESEKIIVEGVFNLINSYAFQDEFVIFSFSEEIKISLTEKNFFNRIHLISLLKFKSKFSSLFYLNFLMRLGDFSEFNIDLSELKKLFDVNDNYERFYDFEKNVLKPILSDINDFTEYFLTYDKVKNTSNKIEQIKFKGINKYSRYIRKTANELIYSVRDYVDDFSTLYNEIYMNLMRKGYKYVYNNLQYCIEHHKDNFSDNFKIILELNPTNSKIEKEIDLELLNKLD